MEKENIVLHIFDSWPYPILLVDCNHIIRYMNNSAKYHYYTEKGYKDLIGKLRFEYTPVNIISREHQHVHY